MGFRQSELLKLRYNTKNVALIYLLFHPKIRFTLIKIMTVNKIIIFENNGTFEIERENLTDFSVIGILECVLFDLKFARTAKAEFSARPVPLNETVEKNSQNDESLGKNREDSSDSFRNAQENVVQNLDLKTRIGNAVKAIRGLGGNIEETDLTTFTEDELRTELEELTAQYKRLKISREKK